ncbi:MAG: VanZ family protein [Eubacterium sp.]|nr:VanZ family protein [Eubacterium sp.]
MDISLWYYLAAFLLFLGVWAVSWKVSAGLLAGYVLFILAVTILSRTPTDMMKVELKLFWSYDIPELREQIIWNVLSFIPVGVLGAVLVRWRGIPMAAGLSVVIELLQLVTLRGLFEFDDTIHNSAGAAAGVVAWMVVCGEWVRRGSDEKY